MVTAVRRFLIAVVVLVAGTIGGLALFFAFTTPRKPLGFSVPLGTREWAMLVRVPQSAEAFALVPAAGALDAKLRANPVSRAALESWTASHRVPPAWMIGGADLLVWKTGSAFGTFMDVDAVRGFLLHLVRSGGSEPPDESPIDAASLGQIAHLASKLPPGDALVVQRGTSRGAYPPIGRPAVTSLQVTATDIRMVSVAPAPAEAPAVRLNPALRLPTSPVLSVAFSYAPRVIADLDRLFGANVSSLLQDGGMVSIYAVKTGTFLPRPLSVIAVPDDPARRAVFDQFARRLGVRTGEFRGMLLLSFDDSIDAFMRDSFQPAPEGRWAVRIDPARMVPILKALGKSLGLRVVAPRLYRSARDLDRWIGGLEQAKAVEAVDDAAGDTETLRVRIWAK